MLRKYTLLFGILIALLLMVIAAFYYPGGSQADINSVGYDWKNNYISNLFSPKAVNGADNSSRVWASCGVFFLSASFAMFFWRASKKIPSKIAANVVKYAGTGACVFAFLAVTPLHDLMVTLSGTCALVAIFYITVFVFRSKLLYLKILSFLCFFVFYSVNFIYYTRIYIVILPVMQKLLLLTLITWILSLEYFTTAADFQDKEKIQAVKG